MKKIAILTNGKNKPQGTFSVGYRTYLPFDKIVLFGGMTPFFVLGTPKWKQKLIRYYFEFISFRNPQKVQKLKEKRLKKILKKNHIQAGLAEFLNTGAESFSVFKELHIPIISNVLGYEINDQRFLKRYNHLYRELADYQSFTIPVAKDMISKLEDFGFKKETIFYSPIGPDESFFKIQPNYHSHQFLFVGRLTKKKSPMNLIQSFKKVNAVHKDSRLIIAGDGELMANVKQLILDLNIEEAVVLLGWISQDKQKELLQNSFCYVQHSITSDTGDKEGTPVSILEASAAGLPVVSTFHAGIPDVVLNDETGFLVNENDIDAMAEKMIYLYENREKAKLLGQKGKEYVYDNFSLKKHLLVVENLLKKAMK